MPLHLYWLWAWVQIFGRSEYAIRAANLPFAALFVLALALASRSVFRRRFAWIPLAFSPFAWLYVNEARPYFMLIAFGTTATAAALAWSFGDQPAARRAPWILLPAVLLAVLTHMLAAFLFPGLLLIIGWSYSRQPLARWRLWITPLIVFGIPAAIVMGFDATTLLRLPAQDGRPPEAVYLAVSLYQHAGLDGLGPPKNLARTDGPAAFAPYAGWLAAGVLALCFVLRNLFRPTRRPEATALAAAWGICFAFAIVAGLSAHTVFLGRHTAALLPLLLFLLLAIGPSTRQCLVLALVWMASDFRLSWLPKYDKDDYRAAVRDVLRRNQQRPGRIVWSADPLTAHYYGLELDDTLNIWPFLMSHDWMKGRVSWVSYATGVAAIDWSPGEAEAFTAAVMQSKRPVYVVLSKPDLYDRKDAWAPIVERHGTRHASYRMFDIFEID